MKALTVNQPWAWAILQGGKRTENRTWPTSYRGPLLIHAGKSTRWLDAEDPALWPARYGVELPPVGQMPLGFILGLVDLVDCRAVAELPAGLKDHPFVEGPYCLILTNPRPFPEPVPYKGQLSIFEIPDSVVTQAIQSLAPLPGGPVLQT